MRHFKVKRAVITSQYFSSQYNPSQVSNVGDVGKRRRKGRLRRVKKFENEEGVTERHSACDCCLQDSLDHV